MYRHRRQRQSCSQQKRTTPKRRRVIHFILLTYLLGGLKLIAMDQSKHEEVKEQTLSLPQNQLPPITYLLGDYLASKHVSFRRVKSKYTDGNPRYLLIPVAKAYEKMAEAALKDGISLKIVSGFRSFKRQKQIWENKFLGRQLVQGKNLLQTYPQKEDKRIPNILLYSAIPGTSRHHWGTDFDLNSVDSSYFQKGKGKEVYEWLKKNAIQFGFFQPYGPNRKAGHNLEEWHWSFFPLSKDIKAYYNKNMNMDCIPKFIGKKYLTDETLFLYLNTINEPHA